MNTCTYINLIDVVKRVLKYSVRKIIYNSTNFRVLFIGSNVPFFKQKCTKTVGIKSNYIRKYNFYCKCSQCIFAYFRLTPSVVIFWICQLLHFVKKIIFSVILYIDSTTEPEPSIYDEEEDMSLQDLHLSQM